MTDPALDRLDAPGSACGREALRDGCGVRAEIARLDPDLRAARQLAQRVAPADCEYSDRAADRRQRRLWLAGNTPVDMTTAHRAVHAGGFELYARPGAQVRAPCDGWVVYAGPFRSYGQLLIVNVGDGYHVLLAGLANISVELGQFVLKGEPVGLMGGVVVASAADVTVGGQQPVLYVEFRKDGRSIDPAPWWANGRTGASG
jgi:murein DD-endopeptidase MepM/ murein hydrolase activator NlpD